MNKKQLGLGLACVARSGSEAGLLRAEGVWLGFRGGAGCCRKRNRGLEEELRQRCGSGSCCGGLVRWLQTRYWDGERSCICSPRPHPGSASGTASAPSRGAAAVASWSAGWADLVRPGDRRGGLGWEGARPWRPRRRVRAEEVGPGGRSAYLCSFVCRRPAHTPHPLVGEAQETTKEFDREAFWRRLSECLSYWRLLSLISSLLLSFLLPPRPSLSAGILLTYPWYLRGWNIKHWFLEVFLRRLSGHGWRGNALSSRSVQPLQPFPFGTNILALAACSVTPPDEAAVTVSREATTLTVAFSRLPLPSPQVGFTFLGFLCCSVFLKKPLIFFPPFTLKSGDLISSSVE